MILKEANVFHDCFGGKIKAELLWRVDDALVCRLLMSDRILELYCHRCEEKIRIRRPKKEIFINTALDGKERKIKRNVRVIQKV